MKLRVAFLFGVVPSLVATACDYPSFEYECRFGTNEGCDAGMKCALFADSGSTKLDCVKSGPKKAWQSCSQDADCARGMMCDLQFLACKPLCASASDCRYTLNDGTSIFEVQGECVPALGSNGQPLGTEFRHCTAGCEPVSSSPCDQPSGVKCFIRGSQGFDCGRGGLSGFGGECKDERDCGAGLLCIETASGGKCAEWCGEQGAECSSGPGTCTPLTPKLLYQKGSNQVELGACYGAN